MPPADRLRLVRLLGMTGSKHDGEALNAMRMANKMLGENKTTWAEVLDMPPPLAPEPPLTPLHVIEAQMLLKMVDHLTPFEQSFLRNIVSFERLSAKQSAVLDRIRQKGIATMCADL